MKTSADCQVHYRSDSQPQSTQDYHAILWSKGEKRNKPKRECEMSQEYGHKEEPCHIGKAKATVMEPRLKLDYSRVRE